MSTVIDELIVVLGLDATQFTKAQREALEDYKKNNEQMLNEGKKTEESANRQLNVFSAIKRGAAGLLAGLGLKEGYDFVARVASADAAVGRLSKTINLSTEELSVWQGAAKSMVGPEGAGSITSVLQGISGELNKFDMGMVASLNGPFATLMARIGGFRNADGSIKKPTDVLTGLAKYMEESGMKTDAQKSAFLSAVPGVDQNTIYMMIQGLKVLQERVELQKKLGYATKESAEAGARMNQMIEQRNSIMDRFARRFEPLIEAVTRGMTAITGLGLGTLDWIFTKMGILKPEKNKDLSSGVERGGSRGDRNNNPGNIKYGALAQRFGATGQDHDGFAVFPDLATGTSAMGHLLRQNYRGLSLSGIQRKWVGNDDPNYLGLMSKSTGLSGEGIPDLRDPAMLRRLMVGMTRGEGTHLSHSTESNTTNVNGNINIYPPNGDAATIAGSIGPAIKRHGNAMKANTGSF